MISRAVRARKGAPGCVAAEQRRAEAERDGEALHSTSCDSITQVRTPARHAH